MLKQWTERESLLLTEYFYTLSREELLKILPGYGHRAILAQVAKLEKKNWKFNR